MTNRNYESDPKLFLNDNNKFKNYIVASGKCSACAEGCLSCGADFNCRSGNC